MKMIEKYLAWSNSIGIEKVRNVTKSLLSYKVRSPEFYRFAISLELKCNPQNSESICKLYDLCIQSGDCPVNMWLDYIGYKLSIGDINGSCHLASKAKREIADQESFMIAYEQFKNSCS